MPDLRTMARRGMTARMDDHQLAARLASEAGKLLLDLRTRHQGRAASLGAAGDLTANALLLAELARHRPGDAILSEESLDDGARLAARRVWIIDPLDGTREYAAGRADWAVHVALTIDGAPAAGAVAEPARARMAATPVVRRLQAARPRPILIISRTRPPQRAAWLAEALGADLAFLGSAGAKAMAVITGEADLYFHEGGQSEWDNCAPVAVALAAGLGASRIDGSAIRYNRRDVGSPDLMIGDPVLMARAIRLLRAEPE